MHAINTSVRVAFLGYIGAPCKEKRVSISLAAVLVHRLNFLKLARFDNINIYSSKHVCFFKNIPLYINLLITHPNISILEKFNHSKSQIYVLSK